MTLSRFTDEREAYSRRSQLSFANKRESSPKINESSPALPMGSYSSLSNLPWFPKIKEVIATIKGINTPRV